MSNTKVIVDFTDYPAPELGTVARHIHTAITANAATFATLPFTLAVFDTLILDYEAKLAARKSKATNDILAFNAVRDVMEEDLATLGNHVNSVAKGDAVICGLSGFPTYTTGAAPDPSAPAAPTNVRLKHAGVTGSAIGRFKASRTPSTNEVQFGLRRARGRSRRRKGGRGFCFLGGRRNVAAATSSFRKARRPRRGQRT